MCSSPGNLNRSMPSLIWAGATTGVSLVPCAQAQPVMARPTAMRHWHSLGGERGRRTRGTLRGVMKGNGRDAMGADRTGCKNGLDGRDTGGEPSENPMNGRPSLLHRTCRSLPLAALAALAAVDATSAPLACTAHSGPSPASVVELYTSEGCSSCPPADRWLSALTTRADVVGLAFHVDYWDRLGWKDRFASPRYTQRQVTQQAVNGARFAYTPQVVVDGHDRADWPQLVLRPVAAKSLVDIVLRRDGDRVTASVTSLAAPTSRLSAYWAITEFGHSSVVRAGENDGATLTHDFVVRAYQPVPAWQAIAGQVRSFGYEVPPAQEGHPRRVNLVVVDTKSGRPLQALALGC
jgi:hypothetical protein